MEKKIHKGWTITFWVATTILGLHYLFIYLPYAIKAGTLKHGATVVGSLVIPVGISFILWRIKVRADKKLNSKNNKEE